VVRELSFRRWGAFRTIRWFSLAERLFQVNADGVCNAGEYRLRPAHLSKWEADTAGKLVDFVGRDPVYCPFRMTVAPNTYMTTADTTLDRLGSAISKYSRTCGHQFVAERTRVPSNINAYRASTIAPNVCSVCHPVLPLEAR
jgi:hypothetical protein